MYKIMNVCIYISICDIYMIYIYVNVYMYIFPRFFQVTWKGKKQRQGEKRNISKKETYMTFLRNVTLLIFLKHY